MVQVWLVEGAAVVESRWWLALHGRAGGVVVRGSKCVRRLLRADGVRGQGWLVEVGVTLEAAASIDWGGVGMVVVVG